MAMGEGAGSGIYVRAMKDGKPGSYDIVTLDRDSLFQWLRSRGGETIEIPIRANACRSLRSDRSFQPVPLTQLLMLDQLLNIIFAILTSSLLASFAD